MREATRTISQSEENKKQYKYFGQAYKQQRAVACARVLAKRPSDPVRFTCLQHDGKLWDFPNKRIGRPKQKWIAHGLDDLWNSVKATGIANLPNTHLEVNTTKTNHAANKKILQTMLDLETSAPQTLQKIAKAK